MTHEPENWENPQTILVILAHPDDPEFFLGGTIARWITLGHRVIYCLLTKGDKGGSDPKITAEQLAAIREVEQRAAAAALGVEAVYFLDQKDGFLTPSAEIRKALVKVIREIRPDIVVTSDPTNYFPSDMYINHPDHRLAGEIAIQAIFPAANNPMFFPELLTDGYEPHHVKEVWFSLTSQPNCVIDVTDEFTKKVQALKNHTSQIGDADEFEKRMMSRHTPESSDEEPRFEENFKRIRFR